MRHESKKAAARRRKYKAERDEYRDQTCQVCRCVAADDVHEIARGIAREAAYGDRACWLSVCRECHESLGDYHSYPIEKQLAIKLISDPDWFDLETVNRIRGRAIGAIGLADVVCFLRRV